MHTKAAVAGPPPAIGFALQEAVCLLAGSVCLTLGELRAAMKICLCSTHFTHYSMQNLAIKTNKELGQLFPQRRGATFPASFCIFRKCPKYPLTVSLTLTWSWLFILLTESICQVRKLRLFVTLWQLMKLWPEASALSTWGQMSCRSHDGSSGFKI